MSTGYCNVFYVCACVCVWGLSSSTGSTFVVFWSVRITRLAPASWEFTRSWREGSRGETRRRHHCEKTLLYFSVPCRGAQGSPGLHWIKTNESFMVITVICANSNLVPQWWSLVQHTFEGIPYSTIFTSLKFKRISPTLSISRLLPN